MASRRFKRVPRHIAFIPDGNRRWGETHGVGKAGGYEHGIDPGVALFDLCSELGVEEITGYGFTQDNTHRPGDQRSAFQAACIAAVKAISTRDATILVVGDTDSPMFPTELLPFTEPRVFGTGRVRSNLLVNYGWEWDLACAFGAADPRRPIAERIGSARISRIDMIVRWGGRRRLSGFLPVQSVYADMFVIDDLWPDFRPEHFTRAIEWYQEQDPTLGG
jgi:undecaprenyl diphosphate synthase